MALNNRLPFPSKSRRPLPSNAQLKTGSDEENAYADALIKKIGDLAVAELHEQFAAHGKMDAGLVSYCLLRVSAAIGAASFAQDSTSEFLNDVALTLQTQLMDLLQGPHVDDN